MRLFQGLLPFTLAVTDDDLSNVTSHAGLAVFLEVLRAVTPKRFYRRLRKALGYKSWRTVRRHAESLVLLIAAGGDHISDIEVLRADLGLARLVGLQPSSPERLKDFLYRFHQDRTGRRLDKGDDLELSVQGHATIRPEGPGLRLLAELPGEVVRLLQRDNQCRTATLDVDATLIEAWKNEALKSYEGFPGYQPQMAWWAEQSAWVADQFRDGNVPAEYEGRAFLIRAFGALPGSVQRRRLRGDSALYNEDALTWADDQDIELSGLRGHEPAAPGEGGGAAGVGLELVPDLPSGRRGGRVAVGGAAVGRGDRLHPGLEAQPPQGRQAVQLHRHPGALPAARPPRGGRPALAPLRGGDAPVVGGFHGSGIVQPGRRVPAVNMDWRGDRLLRWQREKQGTVEHGHGVLKGDLAGGTMPCGRFGSNAAWWRLNVLVANLLQLFRMRSLPAEMRNLRPKALRFRLFNLPGVLIGHARRLVLRISGAHPWAETLGEARLSLLALHRATRAKPALAG